MKQLFPLSSPMCMWFVAALFTALPSQSLFAATYYVDVASGLDTRTPEEAQEPDTPWRTLTRALGEFSPLVYGDTVQVAPGAYVSTVVDGGLETYPLKLVDGVSIRGAGGGTVLYPEVGTAAFWASGELGADTLLADFAIDAPSSAGIEADLDSQLAISLHIDGVDFAHAAQVMVVADPHVGPVLLSPTIENSIFPLIGNGLYFSVRQIVSDVVFSPTLTHNTFNASATAASLNLDSVEGNIVISPVVTDNYVAARSQSYGASMVRIYGYGLSDFDISPVLVGNDIRSVRHGLYLSVYSQREAEGGGVLSPTIKRNEFIGVETVLHMDVSHYSRGVYAVESDVSDNQLTSVGSGIRSAVHTIEGRVEGHYHVEGNLGDLNGDYPLVDLNQEAVGGGSVNLEVRAVENDLATRHGLVKTYFTGTSSAENTCAVEAHRNRVNGSGGGVFVDGILKRPQVGDYTLILNASENYIESVLEGITAQVTTPFDAEVQVVSEVWGNVYVGGSGPLASARFFGGSGSVIDTVLSVHDNMTDRALSGVLAEFGEDSGNDSVAQVNVWRNSFSGNTGYGVKVSQGGINGGSSELGVIVRENTLSGGSRGVDLSLNGLSSGHLVTADLSVEDNEISGCSAEGVGLRLYEMSSGPIVDHTTTISGNVITGCVDGISGRVDSSFSGIQITEDVTIASNQIDESGARGVEYSYDSLSGVALNSELRVVGNAISNSGAEGVWLGLSELNTDAGVVTGQVDWGAVGNAINNPGLDGVAVAYEELGGLIGGDLTFELTGNRVFGAGGYGLSLRGDASGASMSQSGRISGNVLLASLWKGLLIDLSGQGGVSVSDIDVADNLVKDNRLGGATLSTSGYQGGLDTRLSGNTIIDNAGVGVEVEADAATEPIVKVDLGQGPLGSPGRNTLTGNRGYSVVLRGGGDSTGSRAQASQRVGASTLALQGNWWGTTDPAAIAATIFSEVAGVEIDAGLPLDAPPEVGAEVRLTASLDEGEAKEAQPGDIVTLSAQLSIDGDVGCAGARFEAGVPTGAELVEGSVSASLGAPFTSDDVEVGLGWLEVGAEASVSWQVRIPEDTECDALNVQGALSCAQLGEVLSDDPAAPGAEDPTAIGLASFTYYVDADGDGQGNAAEEVSTCHASAPEGLSEVAGDCDDEDATVNPLATETCNGVDDDCDGEVDEALAQAFVADGDGDGYGDPADEIIACDAPRGYLLPSASHGDDCDDSRSDIYPAATEACDGVDNDCDTAVDEDGLSTFYADADGDGHGDASEGAQACSPDVGYVLSSDDCDDDDSSIYPGSPEVCDVIDNDCDGTVDEGGAALVYIDEDGDGFGDPDSPLVGCSPEDGVALVAGDCNDSDAAVYPGAEEHCDGADNDCDGGADEGLQSIWYADEDGDGFGAGGGAVLSCDPGAGLVDNADDCADDDTQIHPGADERCNDLDDDCDHRTDEGVASFYYADADGDGYGDPLTSESACQAPDGMVSDASDCDDGNAAVNPDPESNEVCNGIDDNCDGWVDDAPECEPTSTPGGTDAGGGGGCDSTGGGHAPWLGLIALLPVLGLRRRPVGGRSDRHRA